LNLICSEATTDLPKCRKGSLFMVKLQGHYRSPKAIKIGISPPAAQPLMTSTAAEADTAVPQTT
jgi:hypothetical protein